MHWLPASHCVEAVATLTNFATVVVTLAPEAERVVAVGPDWPLPHPDSPPNIVHS